MDPYSAYRVLITILSKASYLLRVSRLQKVNKRSGIRDVDSIKTVVKGGFDFPSFYLTDTSELGIKLMIMEVMPRQSALHLQKDFEPYFLRRKEKIKLTTKIEVLTRTVRQ